MHQWVMKATKATMGVVWYVAFNVMEFLQLTTNFDCLLLLCDLCKDFNYHSFKLAGYGIKEW